jgi:apolipoprotein N-acyltransferase
MNTAKNPPASSLVLSVLSGVLFALSFQPFGVWPAAWIALVPLVLAVRRCPDAKAAANCGAVAGLVFYVIALRWLGKVFGPMVVAFWCLFALWLALFAAVYHRLEREVDDEFLLSLAAGVVWTGLEYFRSEVWRLNCSWLALGYSQAPNASLLQTCSLIGLYGLSGLIVSANVAFSFLFKRRPRPAFAALAGLAVLALWGHRRAASFPVDEGRPLNVALVQDESYDLERLAKLSLGPGARDADLLVWPEYAFTVQAGMEDSYRKLLARRLKGSRAVSVLGGAIFPEDMKRGKEQNFAWVLSPEGGLLGRYDKLHPIPYVERLLPPNPAPHPVRTPVGTLGVQICYDLDFENGTRRMGAEGAELLVVPNIDPSDWGGVQHAQHSSMSPVRAVESGLWIARAASSGSSQIIDPTGRIRESMPALESGTVLGTVRLRRADTFYARAGWLLPLACLFATALCLGWLAIGLPPLFARSGAGAAS